MSNAVDWATQVSQIKESWPEALAEQARSLGQKIGQASRESQSDSLVKQ